MKYVCQEKLENIPKTVVANVVLQNIAKTLRDPHSESNEETTQENGDDPYECRKQLLLSLILRISGEIKLGSHSKQLY